MVAAAVATFPLHGRGGGVSSDHQTGRQVWVDASLGLTHFFDRLQISCFVALGDDLSGCHDHTVRLGRTKHGCTFKPRNGARYGCHDRNSWRHAKTISYTAALVSRLEEKFGWLLDYREALARWEQLQRTIDVTVHFVRTQRLYKHAAEDLKPHLNQLPLGETASELRSELVAFVADQASKTRPGERLPGSSEVIESCFGKFKSVERDQSRGGFTGLLLALAACVGVTTRATIQRAMEGYKTARVLQWIKNNLGATLGSKRRLVYGAITPKRTATEPAVH